MENTKKIKRLPDAELEIMFVVWGMKPPVTSKAVLKELKRPWALATLMTVLTRLCDKGFLSCEKVGHNNFYSAAVTKEEYKKLEGRSFLERVYSNDITDLVASLYESSAISDSDLTELRSFIDKKI
ncbi:MAG: BlaI/MecI/CopY family transcriptional regulator [Ruminococcaceae bacterium]|nr:BlaI/MecI/CopY family transcriptional regulator [Oscillospiraceae bacterium]